MRLLITLMIGAAGTSETSVNFYQTTLHNNPEDSHLHACRCENLKSQFFSSSLCPVVWFIINTPGVNLTSVALVISFISETWELLNNQVQQTLG
jgi:hypothetical protein